MKTTQEQKLELVKRYAELVIQEKAAKDKGELNPQLAQFYTEAKQAIRGKSNKTYLQ